MLTAALAALALAAAPPAAFPKPDRPVASVVSPTWWNAEERDAAREVPQIVRRLGVKPGWTIADIGAGDGYDSLRLAKVVGPQGRILAEDITAEYLKTLTDRAKRQGLANITAVVGLPHDPKLPPASADAAILVHMYHEIAQPYAFLWNLAPALKPGGKVGVEELDRGTAAHGTPQKLLVCEFQAVGYRLVDLKPLTGGLGYFAVFTAPAPDQRPAPVGVKACRG